MIQERKCMRLKDHDYSQNGYYFITICVKNMECVLGEIRNDQMILNEYGKIIKSQWLWLFNNFKCIEIDEFIIMPNHFHGIIKIDNTVGDGRDHPLRKKKIKPLPELIGAFKTTTSKLIHLSGNKTFQWQRSYYDHIVRDDEDLNRIREYIIYNPLKWNEDDEIPENYFNKEEK